MKRSRFSEEQIAYALRLAESGTPVVDVCRQIGVSEATYYTWKKKFGDLGVTGAQAPEDAHERSVYVPASHLYEMERQGSRPEPFPKKGRRSYCGTCYLGHAIWRRLWVPQHRDAGQTGPHHSERHGLEEHPHACLRRGRSALRDTRPRLAVQGRDVG
ncbi:transposase [Hydrogenophaga sp.]|uniref:transposase n=1 Tax=Hydrogenophaga sp. TaxID=1904254 RepID=UPI002FC811EA